MVIDFNFSIVNFLYLCSNTCISFSPAYKVFVSQLIRYARTCSTYEQFLKRDKLLTNKLMKRDYQQSRLKSSFRKLYGRCSMVVTTTFSTNTTSDWRLSILLFQHNYSPNCLRISLFSRLRKRTHGRCDWSAEDA